MGRVHHRLWLRSESGQGIVEYILVLVVTIALVLGMVVQFNSAFQSWANNYFGDYLACLLETGELPSLGGPMDVSGDTSCNQLFEPFSLAKGRPHLGKAISGEASGASLAASAAAGRSQSEADKSGGSSGSYTRASRGGGGRFGRLNSMSDGARFKTSFKDRSDSSVYTGSTESTNFGSANPYGGGEFVRVAPINDRFSFTDEKDQKSGKGGKSLVKRNTASELRPTRMKVIPKPAKKSEQTADSDLGIGDYIRYLLIAAIIIALVLFFGGQALQMSRSMD